MKRVEAIKHIMSTAGERTVVVSSNGMISREVFHVKHRDLNFYMLGSMGCALGIGVGIAYSRPDLNVIVISGDGSALMGLGTIILHRELIEEHGMRNLSHYILDNNSYSTTGGQKTCSDSVNFESLCAETFVLHVTDEKGIAPRIPLSPLDIKKGFMNAVANIKS